MQKYRNFSREIRKRESEKYSSLFEYSVIQALTIGQKGPIWRSSCQNDWTTLETDPQCPKGGVSNFFQDWVEKAPVSNQFGSCDLCATLCPKICSILGPKNGPKWPKMTKNRFDCSGRPKRLVQLGSWVAQVWWHPTRAIWTNFEICANPNFGPRASKNGPKWPKTGSTLVVGQNGWFSLGGMSLGLCHPRTKLNQPLRPTRAVEPVLGHFGLFLDARGPKLGLAQISKLVHIARVGCL